MNIGIDIVEIERISKTISGSTEFVNKILHPEEIKNWDIQSICGKIAAKEAMIKTGYITSGDWKKVKILSAESGKPQVYDENGRLISGMHLSISHTSSLAIAVAIYE